MKNLFKFIMSMLACQVGAVVYDGDNYTKQWVTKPPEKLPKGEVSGKVRCVVERKTLVDSTGLLGLDAGDTIRGPFIPASCMVVDAYLHINKTLGATGVFSLGHLASDNDHDADPDAFVKAADAGGQPVLARPDLSAADEEQGILKRFTEPVQMNITCTTVMDDTVVDGVITAVVFYISD